MLFADDAAISTHSEQELQALMDRLSAACKDFGLIISLPKTNILSQGTTEEPTIKIDNYELEVVSQFTYLGSTITDNLSLDVEINRRIGKAATTLSRLRERVWKSSKLTVNTKMSVYSTCVLSTLLYSSETWTTYARHEVCTPSSAFHGKTRRTDFEILSLAGLPTMYTLLRQRRLRWLGHVHRMDDGRIPKDLLYGELKLGVRGKGRPQLRYKDVCKRDMKALEIDETSWEGVASDRVAWRRTLRSQLVHGEGKLKADASAK